ncbi:MAG: 6,7-dimethyl-8-ribityllumazine synthase [Candidatus Gallionella acididurans]|uniref:6,7-dimethyl-8-ribityllumazine synthase n=1 Tax=Candidatus Gallionella acididurans TaxID=1796491 RepID=A0A139BXQ4_9PROT|nr:MAG: 6,7-dimethyl-8-ribityllumazine synthase [Candidatus Gallionella acididurans]
MGQDLAGRDLRVGIVQSRFNTEVCEGLLGACRAQLVQQGVREDNITLATVPGALEIPLVLQRMAMSGRFDALIALGAVIRGDTYHFEIVANESARCVGEVQLHTGVPIANAILTTDTDEQAIARMHAKGGEAALVAIEMANLLRGLA